MRKHLKKISALLLLTVIFLTAMPFNILTVFATAQNPVTWQRIYGRETFGNKTDYTIFMSWRRPVFQSGQNFTNHTPSDGGAGYYEILYSKGTSAASGFQTFTRDFEGTARTDAELQFQKPNVTLDPGSLYAFRIVPYHQEVVEVSPTDRRINNVSPPLSSIQDMLFLSDIRVKGEGSGNTLTITWDNPTFDGVEIFEAWDIYYTLGNSSTVVYPEPIRVNSANLARQGTSLVYTISDDSIKPGRQYTVKVEPVLRGEQLRDKTKSDISGITVTINGRTYSDISFSPKNSGRDYRADDIVVKIPLYVVENDAEHILLYWFGLGSLEFDDNAKIEIEESASGTFQSDKKITGTIRGKQNVEDNTNWITVKPPVRTAYRLKITHKDGETYSEIAWYSPTFTDFRPNKPIVREFTHNANPLALSVVWEAFVRDAYTSAESASVFQDGKYKGKYLDKNVEYNIYVADSLTLLDSLDESQAVATVRGNDLAEFEYNGVYAYRLDGITRYATGTGGSITMKSGIDENKIYYVKIVPRRIMQDNTPGLVGEAAFGAHFVPTDNIYTQPFMLSKPPLRIKTGSDGIEAVTTDSVTIQWETQYYEVYNPADSSWYSKIGLDSSGKLIYGDAVLPNQKYTEMTLYGGYKVTDGESGITAAKAKLAAALGIDADKLAVRYIDLTNAKFEIHTAAYDVYGSYDSYEAYLETIRNVESAWKGPIADTNYNPTREYTVTGLAKETAYLFIIRPYIVLPAGDKLRALEPANITATTLSDRPIVEIKPTVPILVEVEEGDMYLTVKWLYNPLLKYELKYSELFSEYPDLGILISNDDIAEKGVQKTENGEVYIYYTIRVLFPETTYYLWIRAYADNPSGTAYSNWSNAISMKTTDIKPPDPPQGLGLVAENHLEIYNKENSKTYVQVDFDYMIIEWLRDQNDIFETTAQEMTDAHEILSSPGFSGTYIIKFNELIANRSYYIRAKTRLTVSKTPNGVMAEYQYIVQLSKTDDFVDYVQIIVPDTITGGTANGTGVFIQKESAWSNVVRLYTSPWTGEYDGDKDPDKYPLPENDYEIIYDPATDTLTFRFRTDKTDAQGNKDNNVDQRFISKLVASGIFDYTVDLSAYGGRSPSNRTLELPYSVVTAFSERKISLTVICGNTTFVLPPDFIKTPEVHDMAGFGYGSFVNITVNENPPGLPAIESDMETYSVTPQKLSINVSNGITMLPLKYTGRVFGVLQTVRNISLIEGKNAGGYLYTANSGGWTRMDDSVNEITGTVNFNTSEIGVYAVISRFYPSSTRVDERTQAAMTRINSGISIEGLKTFDPTAPVTAGQFNKLIAAVALSSKSVNINDLLTESEQNSLTKSGMIVPDGAQVSREAGISALVKLYENKTKSIIRSYTPIESTSYADIQTASEAYRNDLLKAGDIGFYENERLARPKDAMTMGEFIRIIDMIIQAGK